MADKKLCFVVSPIGKPDSEVRTHADWVLDGIIRPVMVKFPDFLVKRADSDARPGQIDVHMIDDLLNADLVIADLSLLNPNVFYEIGIRHMVQKPIIHMQLDSEDVPFDVSLYRAIKFSREKYHDLEAAKSELVKAVQAVLADGYQIENPVTSARGRIKLEQSATPAQQVILQELAELKTRVNRIGRRETEHQGWNQYRVWSQPGIDEIDIGARAGEYFGQGTVTFSHKVAGEPFTLTFSFPDTQKSDKFLDKIASIPGVQKAEFIGFNKKSRISRSPVMDGP